MYVERDAGKEIVRSAKLAKTVVLVGPRQSGKTTLLRKLAPSGIFVSLDDPDALELFNSDAKAFAERFLSGRKLAVLDEAQYGSDAGRKIKFFNDFFDARLWVTGSSEALLSEKVLSFLVGRARIVRLYPFSLAELLRARKASPPGGMEAVRLLWEHAVYGGYPRVVLERSFEDKQRLLEDILATLLLKEVGFVLGRHRELEVRIAARTLALGTGNLLNWNDFCSTAKLNYRDAVETVNAMEKSCLLKLVPPFHTNKRTELSKTPKVFFIDTGLRNALVRDYRVERPDAGALLENLVFAELLKAGFEPRYWRSKSKAEVDFVVGNEKPIPIEVKVNQPDGVPRGLQSFIAEYSPPTAFVISPSGRGEKRIGGTRVVFTTPFELAGFLAKKAGKGRGNGVRLA